MKKYLVGLVAAFALAVPSVAVADHSPSHDAQQLCNTVEGQAWVTEQNRLFHYYWNLMLEANEYDTDLAHYYYHEAMKYYQRVIWYSDACKVVKIV